MTSRPLPGTAPRWQRGSALLFSLLILLAMTIIGVAAMQAVSLEERMAGNMRDQSLAFQAAEAALRAAEVRLKNGAGLAFDCNGGFLPSNLQRCNWNIGNGDPDPQKVPLNVLETTAYSAEYVFGDPAQPELFSNPRYVVEELNDPGDSTEAGAAVESPLYRISARGVGRSESAVAIVQSTFRR